MKTRQQRRAKGRAGHPSSPPQQLPIKTRGPRRTRAKQLSVGETPASSPAPAAGGGQVTVAAGALAPAAQLAVPGEVQQKLRISLCSLKAFVKPNPNANRLLLEATLLLPNHPTLTNQSTQCQKYHLVPHLLASNQLSNIPLLQSDHLTSTK